MLSRVFRNCAVAVGLLGMLGAGSAYAVAGVTGRPDPAARIAELRRLVVTQKHSRLNHPTTCGKVERFHQTLQRELLDDRRRLHRAFRS